MLLRNAIIFLLLVPLACSESQDQPESSTTSDRSAQVCIYGGTSAGVIAAYSAAQKGLDVVLIEPTRHLGGMTASGLGSTDIGNKHVVQGLARDFYRRVGQHYGNLENWTFEPHVAEAIFLDFIKRGKVEVIYERRITGSQLGENRIQSITLEHSSDTTAGDLSIQADYFMDCSYEGDLMAQANVSYFIGREDNSLYKETLNGVQLRNKHQFPDGIDPYIKEGDSTSGLLPFINPEPVAPNGTGDDKIQAYNYRLCLTKDSNNRMPFPKPQNYNPQDYELLWRVMKKNNQLNDKGEPLAAAHSKDYDHAWQWTSFATGFIVNWMPEEKTDFNHLGGFSIDYIGQNHEYPTASYEERAAIFEEHKQFILGIFHFLTHDPRVPEKIKQEARKWGLPKDEFEDNGGWPYYLYVRETRRLQGEVVMTEHHCRGDKVVKDPIAKAAYTMDSHNCQRVVVNGMVKNEGNVEVGGFAPYGISYRSLVPKQEECENLIVPVCMSASHIAYGSIRMEPVFMVLGQVSTLAVAQAVQQNIPLQQVAHEGIVEEMEEDPYLDERKPDVVLDDAMTAHFAATEHSERKKLFMHAYDTSFVLIEKAGQKAYMQFTTPELSGQYDAYFYIPSRIEKDYPNLTDSMAVSVLQDMNVVKKVPIALAGNTGKLVPLCSIELKEPRKVAFKVTALRPGQTILSDAILLVPKNQ